MADTIDPWERLRANIDAALAADSSGESLRGRIVALLDDFRQTGPANVDAGSGDRLVGGLWQEVVDASPDFMAVLDDNGVLHRLNRSLARALDRRPEDIAGHRWRRVVPKSDSLHDLFSSVHLAIRTGTDAFETVDLQTGQIYAVSLNRIRGDSVTPLYALHVRDISTPRMREELLRQSHDILQRARDVIFLIDPGGYFSSVSPSVHHLIGYAPHEVVGRHYGRFIPHSDKIRVHRFLLRMQERFVVEAETADDGGLDAVSLELRLRHKTLPGERGLRHVEMVIQPMCEAGGLIGFQGVVRDITERKLAEDALRKSEERYRSLIETMDEGLVSIDASGRVDYVNPAFEDMSGYPGARIKDRPVTDLLDARNALIMRRILGLFAQGRTRHVVCRLSFLSETGHRMHARVSVQPRRDAQGRVVSAILVISDITEMRRLERRLKSALIAAKAASRAKSEFLAGMSHEIRTPLNAVIGLTGLLAETDLSLKQENWVGLIGTASRNLLELIDNILDMSKIEAGKLELEEVNFNPREILRSLIAMFSPKAQAQDIELDMQVDDDVPAFVRGDVVRVKQVLANLITNGLKFTSRGRVDVRLGVQVRGESEHLLFEVRDTGKGIAPGNLNRIFGNFSQEDGSITRTHGGTGLGLSISRRLVELMGGRIGVRSELGKGSCFHFHIPMQLGGKPKVRLPRVGNYRALRILVAEDNLSNRLVLENILQTGGHTTTMAENGLQAVDLAHAGGFDVIILDVRMPVMDGISAASEIRRFDNRTPVVILTADALKETMQACVAAGADHFLTKPIDPPRLLEMLSLAVNQDGDASPASADREMIQGCPAVQDSSPVLFDAQDFLSRLGGNAKVLGMILAGFFTDDGPGMLRELREVIASGDLDGVRESAHKLKGASANTSLKALSRCALALEKLAASGKSEGLLDSYDELFSTYTATATAVREFLDRNWKN